MAGLSDFTVDDLESFSRVLRVAGDGAHDMAAVAGRVTEHFHRHLCRLDGTPACVSVSLHKTHPYRLLPTFLQEQGPTAGGDQDSLICLVRLAISGSAVRSLPSSAVVLPLDAAGIEADPFLPSLTASMGIDADLLLDPVRVVQEGLHRDDVAAFQVPELLTTSWLDPDARDQAEEAGARSLLALGGGLPTGELFFLWIVGRERPSDKSARFLRALTPAIKTALIPHALRPWRERPPSEW